MKFFACIAAIWRFWAILILAGLTAIYFSACSPVRLKNQANQSQLVLLMLVDPITFNAALAEESRNTIFDLIYEGLITENPVTGKKEPALAKSWNFSEDNLKIVFTLRPGLKWSDGHPLTVDDVIFSYNHVYLNEEIPSLARDSLRIGQSRAFPKVRKLDDLQVEFIITEAFAPFLDSVELPILPKHILQKTVENRGKDGKPIFLSTWGVDTPPEQIIVNGPYKIKSYSTSERLIFSNNPYYWKKDEHGNQLPYIKRVIWAIVESTDTSLIQFRSGSLDSIEVAPQYFSLLKQEEKRGNFTIYNGGTAYDTNYISFNLNKGKREGKPLVDPIKSRWFNNVNFRRAVAYAIDRQRIINNIFQGLGNPQDSDIFAQSPFYYKNIKRYDYNPQKAKNLLLSEGFKYSEKQELLDQEGNRVRFNLITNAGIRTRESMGVQIQEDLGKIGIQVDYSPIGFHTLIDKLDNTLDWECYLLGFSAGNEPNNRANIWLYNGTVHTFNQKAQPGNKPIEGREVAEWENQIEELYIQGAIELDFEKRKAMYVEAQRLIHDYVPFIYLVTPYSMAAVRNDIKGIQYSALSGAFWNLEKLKISK
ncbi:ABC transporter substrate-binding protein [Plectonema radiosum NIES-515]|uniref:ABC transporter substrate-binding protein n=1 Tax=Plectonema radiosum NIES-515 TaxID=2986073 RepID=A0ABT3B7Q8_9CYAN|nr:ABC transporter substrate-binding protein [Plectonema radiosum]MCV3216975.1 ABC transporter substrate-binding protein [Plectonema radiosum NIES-515]